MEKIICPTCGKEEEKDIIEALGCCRRCDHIMGEANEMMESYDSLEEMEDYLEAH